MGTVKIGEYFYEDCRVFLAKFKNKESLLFDAFAEVWQEMKFSFIFSPWKYMGEMQEIVEEYLEVCKTIWLRSEGMEERVCGLYLLRAVYHKQPAAQYVKISLSHEDWQLMKQFLYVIKDFVQNETRFVLQELFELKAFTISVPSCTPTEGKQNNDMLESAVSHFTKAHSVYRELFSAFQRETIEYNEERKACVRAYPELREYPKAETDRLVEQLMGRLKVFEEEVGEIREDLLEENVSSVRVDVTASGEIKERKSVKGNRYLYGARRVSACSETEESSGSEDDGANLDMPQLVHCEDSDAAPEDEGSFDASAAHPGSDADVHLSDFQLSSSADEEDSPKRHTATGLSAKETEEEPVRNAVCRQRAVTPSQLKDFVVVGIRTSPRGKKPAMRSENFIWPSLMSREEVDKKEVEMGPSLSPDAEAEGCNNSGLPSTSAIGNDNAIRQSTEETVVQEEEEEEEEGEEEKEEEEEEEDEEEEATSIVVGRRRTVSASHRKDFVMKGRWTSQRKKKPPKRAENFLWHTPVLREEKDPKEIDTGPSLRQSTGETQVLQEEEEEEEEEKEEATFSVVSRRRMVSASHQKDFLMKGRRTSQRKKKPPKRSENFLWHTPVLREEKDLKEIDIGPSLSVDGEAEGCSSSVLSSTSAIGGDNFISASTEGTVEEPASSIVGRRRAVTPSHLKDFVVEGIRTSPREKKPTTRSENFIWPNLMSREQVVKKEVEAGPSLSVGRDHPTVIEPQEAEKPPPRRNTARRGRRYSARSSQ